MAAAVAPLGFIGVADALVTKNWNVNSGNWNALFVRHADSSVAWYGHLKNGSLTPKVLGDPVATGEVLGIVASSGSSTGPHLHFELHDAAGGLLDPWAGSCNRFNPDSEKEIVWGDQTFEEMMIGFFLYKVPVSGS